MGSYVLGNEVPLRSLVQEEVSCPRVTFVPSKQMSPTMVLQQQIELMLIWATLRSAVTSVSVQTDSTSSIDVFRTLYRNLIISSGETFAN